MKPKNQRKFLCPMCVPNATEVGEIIGGYWLALIKGKLTVTNGSCAEHHEFVFQKPPLCEVVPRRKGESEKTYDRRYEKLPKTVMEKDLMAIREAKRVMGSWKMPLGRAYGFVKDCERAGYDKKKDGHLTIWFYFRCGEAWKKHMRGQ